MIEHLSGKHEVLSSYLKTTNTKRKKEGKREERKEGRKEGRGDC
jgi:hypothetical protein